MMVHMSVKKHAFKKNPPSSACLVRAVANVLKRELGDEELARFGEPPGCLRLAYKERTGGVRNVFFGLVELAPAFPQQCMPADPM